MYKVETDELILDASKRLDQYIYENPEVGFTAVNFFANRIKLKDAPITSKLDELIKLSDEVNQKIAPYMACKKGCGNCCSAITWIKQHEADKIQEYTGRKAQRLAVRSQNQWLEAGQKFAGELCPFSKNNECTIYEVRPIVCRTHNNFVNDVSRCDVTNPDSKIKPILSFNADLVEVPYDELARELYGEEAIGEISEFFPTIKGDIK